MTVYEIVYTIWKQNKEYSRIMIINDSIIKQE